MNRNEFLLSVLGRAAAGAAGLALLACGGDDGGAAIDASPGNCLQDGTRTSIFGNHGHVVMVPAADVATGSSRTYDITGGADHAHSVTITAAHFATLAANGEIQATSTSGGGHTHAVTVRCA